MPAAGDDPAERSVAGGDRVDVERLRVEPRRELDDVVLGHVDRAELEHAPGREVFEEQGHGRVSSKQRVLNHWIPIADSRRR